ncbi:sodium:calcium antiporter [Candidatus Woesearchaeota archaeon]|nr:sodium:calcium antiporter [Candidatus Woesearchaeota archaeon]
MIITNLLLFLVACFVMVESGAYLVKSIATIARFMRYSEFLVSFVLVAFSTSLPELLVGINAALDGTPALALGNVIGSNIVNMSLIIGLIVIVGRGINVTSKTVRKDTIMMFVISLLPLFLYTLGNQISRIDGAILIAVFIVYMRILLKQRKEFHKTIDHVSRKHLAKDFLVFLISAAILLVSAKFVVRYAGFIADQIGFSYMFVGLVLLAVGTSLPELVFGLKAALGGHPEMSVGDIIGATVINSTFIVGVTALIMPIEANFVIFLSSSVFMLVIGFLFMTFLESESRLSVNEGIALVLMYVFFIIIEFYIKGISAGSVPV